jgi:uncharacterized metal-binding protein YceD (DUF177 family)
MDQSKDYTKRYRQNPLTLKLDIHNLRAGLYRINGDVEEESWQKVCETAGIKPAGEVSIDIDMQKYSYKLHLTGTINTNVEMVCIRSLKPFEKKIDIVIDEEIFLTDPREGEEADEILKDDTFDAGDFIKQIIQLNVDPYPIHESTLNVPKGEFGLEDGLKEEVQKEKNPFAVLKDLKSE